MSDEQPESAVSGGEELADVVAHSLDALLGEQKIAVASRALLALEKTLLLGERVILTVSMCKRAPARTLASNIIIYAPPMRLSVQ